MSATAVGTAAVAPVIPFGTIAAGVVAVGAIGAATVIAAREAKKAIDAMAKELEPKLLMPYEGVLDLQNIPSDCFMDSVQLESSLELVASQSAALYQNASTQQQIQAQKLGLVKVAQKLPSPVLAEQNVLSAMEAVKTSQTSLQLDAAKKEVIHALKESNLTVQKQVLTSFVMESGAEIGFPMKLEKNQDNTIRLIGKSSNQAIVTELKTDKQGRLEFKSETLNNCDANCTNTLKSFYTALEKRGVQFDKTNIRPKQEALQMQRQRNQNVVHAQIQKRRR